MRRLMCLAVALVFLLPGRGDAKTTCDAGKTAYAQGHTRVFSLYHKTKFYVCSATLRRPRLFLSGVNDLTGDSLSLWKPFGRRLAYLHAWVGGDDEGWSVGWIDLHTGASDEACFTDCVHQDPAIVSGFRDVSAFAVAADGSVAALVGKPPAAQQIVYAPFGARGFGPAHVLTTATGGDVVPSSLAIAGGSVTWTITSGAAGSTPIG